MLAWFLDPDLFLYIGVMFVYKSWTINTRKIHNETQKLIVCYGQSIV